MEDDGIDIKDYHKMTWQAISARPYRLAYCEPCLDKVFAGDHRDGAGNFREVWRCPMCRTDRGGETPCHDSARGETLPRLAEVGSDGWCSPRHQTHVEPSFIM